MTLYIYDFIHFCCLFLNLLKTFIVSLIWSFYFELRLWLVTLHGKWSFPLKIFLVNLNKTHRKLRIEQTHLETWTNTQETADLLKSFLMENLTFCPDSRIGRKAPCKRGIAGEPLERWSFLKDCIFGTIARSNS